MKEAIEKVSFPFPNGDLNSIHSYANVYQVVNYHFYGVNHGKYNISMATSNSKLLVYQRINWILEITIYTKGSITPYNDQPTEVLNTAHILHVWYIYPDFPPENHPTLQGKYMHIYHI